VYQILVVEDSVDIYEGLSAFLRDEGFGVTVADTQRSAIAALEKEDADFDLALVDLALPDGNGTIVYRVAEEYDVPVIFLTAYDDEYTVSKGLDMGAADYIPKPYRKRELLSRINRVLRERGKMNAEIVFGDLRVDTAKGNVYKNGEEIFLSRLEYKLLLYFMNRPGQLRTRDALFNEIWSITGEYITDNTLTVHIKRLREKIEDDPQNPKYIQTVRGMGYKFGD
jgi:DNA-binding response OmpR family regulator